MKKDIFPFWKFGVILLLIACLMVITKALPQLDFITWLQSTGSSREIKFLQFISDSITFFSLGVPLVLALYGEFIKKEKKSWLLFLYVGLSVGLAGLISYAIKNIGLVPRPYHGDRSGVGRTRCGSHFARFANSGCDPSLR